MGSSVNFIHGIGRKGKLRHSFTEIFKNVRPLVVGFTMAITYLSCWGLLKLMTLIKTTAIATYKQHLHKFRKLASMVKNKGISNSVRSNATSDVIHQKSNPIYLNPDSNVSVPAYRDVHFFLHYFTGPWSFLVPNTARCSVSKRNFQRASALDS